MEIRPIGFRLLAVVLITPLWEPIVSFCAVPGGPDLRELCKIQAERRISGSALSRAYECNASSRLILTTGKIQFCKSKEKI